MSLTRCRPIHHVVIEEKRPPRMKKVNQYLMVSKLGTGFSSKVYLALNQDENIYPPEENKKCEPYYAAKAIRVHERRLNCLSSTNLEREINFLRSLDHPNIIKLHSVLYAPSTDLAYVIMEWANCGTLQHAISNNFKFNENTIAPIYIQIALAISYMHSKEIAHRDVKPSNILLFSDGTAKLSDFGISHSFESAESVIGTPSYQSPDLFEEGDDDLNDIFSDSDNSGFCHNRINFRHSNDDFLKDNYGFSQFSKNETSSNLSKLNNHITFNDDSSINKSNSLNNLALNEANDYENDMKEKRIIDPKKGMYGVLEFQCTKLHMVFFHMMVKICMKL